MSQEFLLHLEVDTERMDFKLSSFRFGD